MARVALTLQDAVRTGLNPTFTAATVDGHGFDNSSERVILIVKNDHATTPTTVTIATPGTIDGLAITDLAVSVPATSMRIIGPFPSAVYAQNDGTLSIKKCVYVNTSSQASVTYAAVKVPVPSFVTIG
jgi:hypothetical protein